MKPSSLFGADKADIKPYLSTSDEKPKSLFGQPTPPEGGIFGNKPPTTLAFAQPIASQTGVQPPTTFGQTAFGSNPSGGQFPQGGFGQTDPAAIAK